MSLRADFRVGKVRHAIRKSDFSSVLRKRRCHPSASGKRGLDLEKPRQLQASLETPRDSKDFKDSK